MGEILAIWVAGVAVLLLVAIAAGVFLRFTRVGREQGVTVGELLKVLGVVVVLSCAVLTLLGLAL